MRGYVSYLVWRRKRRRRPISESCGRDAALLHRKATRGGGDAHVLAEGEGAHEWHQVGEDGEDTPERVGAALFCGEGMA
jgi:hypothetical protein